MKIEQRQKQHFFYLARMGFFLNSILALSLLLGIQIAHAEEFLIDFNDSANYDSSPEIQIANSIASLKEESIWNQITGLWRMDSDGAVIPDASGNGNDLTNTGTTLSAAGIIGNSLNFEEGDYLSGNYDDLNMHLDDLTISAWVKTSDEDGSIVAKSFYSAEDERYAVLFSRGHLRTLFDGGANKQVDIDGTPYLDGNWHHIVVTFDRDGDSSLFVDGTFKGSVDISSDKRDDFDKDNLFLIGAYNSVDGTEAHSSALRYSGEIDEVALWKRVLNQEEIAEIYAGGSGKRIEKHPSGIFSLSNKNALSDSELTRFTSFESIGAYPTENSFRYQLSDDGSQWKYWDGNAWVEALNDNETNSESEVNTAIGSFPTDAKQLFVKVFFLSNGDDDVEIDGVRISYEVNHPPTDISLNSNEFNEGLAVGSTIAQMSTTDLDANDQHTYALVPGEGAEDNDSFFIDGTSLQTGVEFDFEEPHDRGDGEGNNTYSIRIRSTDSAGTYTEKTFVLTVRNVNEPPLLPESMNYTVLEGEQTVGTLSAEDPDTGDTITYSIAGGEDANKFSINSETGAIRFTTSPDYEHPLDANGDNTYLFIARASDRGGLSTESEIRVVVQNADDDEMRNTTRTIRKGSARTPRAVLLAIFHPELFQESNSEREKVTPTEEINSSSCTITSSNTLIRRGDHGENVRALQLCLQSLGIDPGPIDGIFGPLTEQAVKSFQKKAQLRWIDGIVGPETLHALMKEEKEE